MELQNIKCFYPFTDDDECEDNNGGCSDTCVNTGGSYHCQCPTGYELDDDGLKCEGINNYNMSRVTSNSECFHSQRLIFRQIMTIRIIPSHFCDNYDLGFQKMNAYWEQIIVIPMLTVQILLVVLHVLARQAFQEMDRPAQVTSIQTHF